MILSFYVIPLLWEDLCSRPPSVPVHLKENAMSLGSSSVQEDHLRAPWSWLGQHGEHRLAVARLEMMK
jgi:hypothetical protein